MRLIYKVCLSSSNIGSAENPVYWAVRQNESGYCMSGDEASRTQADADQVVAWGMVTIVACLGCKAAGNCPKKDLMID